MQQCLALSAAGPPQQQQLMRSSGSCSRSSLHACAPRHAVAPPPRARGAQQTVGSQVWQQAQQQQRLIGGGASTRQRVVARASIDDPEIQELVVKLDEMTPQPPADRPMLDRALALIDEANSEDPTRVTVDGQSVPYRLAYSRWMSEWVQRLDPKASDELLILARGRSIQSWKLADLKRDDYPPNTPGQRQWEMDRKKWLAQRLVDVVKEAGYDESVQLLVEDVMMSKNVPDPRDIRKYDLIGVFGLVNYRTLQGACIIQTLDDAEALLFLDKNFNELFNRMPADEVAVVCKRELSRLSQRGIVTVLKQKWSPVQQRLLQKVLPVPFKFNNIMMEVEGMAAASTHPGDWRYKNFDYE